MPVMSSWSPRRTKFPPRAPDVAGREDAPQAEAEAVTTRVVLLHMRNDWSGSSWCRGSRHPTGKPVAQCRSLLMKVRTVGFWITKKEDKIKV